MQQQIWDLQRQVQQLQAQLQHVVMPMTQTEVTSETGQASVQFSYAGGTASDTQIMQQYGFWSRPLTGSNHAVLNFGGMAGQGASIASSDERWRPTNMAPGDCVIGDNQGQYVWLSSGNINIHTAGTVTINSSGDMSITAPNLNISANVAITGTLTDNSHDVGSTHKHTQTQSGSGISGVPQ